MPSSYLVAVAIGPVQDFIAASRKTRDLWYGSTLLSRNAEQIALALRDAGAELIFPALDPDHQASSDMPFPNKLLMTLKSNDPAALLEQVEQKARESLVKDLIAVLKKLDANRDLPFIHQELAEAQARDFLEFYAAWVPFNEGDSYPDQRLRVEHLLAARKRIRDFARAPGISQFTGVSFDEADALDQGKRGVAKSSLDPGRETVLRAIHPTYRRYRPSSAENPMGEIDDRRRLHIKRGEQLDGVSLIKRLGDVRRFVSVSRIAIDPFIRRLDQETLDMLCAQAEALKQSSAVDRLTLKNQDDLRQFAKFPYDTQLFYDPTESDEEMSDDDKRKAKVFYDTVRAACTRLEIGELPNKVAILSADGDHMGEAISKRTEIGQHRDFSRKLAVFAADARTIVAEHQGAAVYTGGDDVLAMLPLDRVLDCADALRKRFDDVNRDKPKGSATVTLSVGIAIGHYSTHLQSLLKWSRAAEHAAKDRGRNALAIAVHSGDSQSEGALFVHSWDDDPVATRWQHWIDWYRTETISRGAGYELRDLARDYADVNQSLLTKRKYPEKAPDGEDQLCSLLELDVQHLLQSKRPDGSNAMRPSEIQELRDALNNSVKGVRDLAEELIAALHFEQAITIANGPPKQQQVAPNATEPETTQDNHVTTPDEEGKP